MSPFCRISLCLVSRGRGPLLLKICFKISLKAADKACLNFWAFFALSTTNPGSFQDSGPETIYLSLACQCWHTTKSRSCWSICSAGSVPVLHWGYSLSPMQPFDQPMWSNDISSGAPCRITKGTFELIYILIVPQYWQVLLEAWVQAGALLKWAFALLAASPDASKCLCNLLDPLLLI